MYIICGGLKMARFKIERKYLINFLYINMNTNDYQFHLNTIDLFLYYIPC